MEKILAGGANTDGKEIAAFEQKASFKIRVVRNAYRFCSVIFTALLLCLAGCDNEWDASKDLTIGQDWLEEAETDTADRLESDIFREDDGSEPQAGGTLPTALRLAKRTCRYSPIQPFPTGIRSCPETKNSCTGRF